MPACSLDDAGGDGPAVREGLVVAQVFVPGVQVAHAGVRAGSPAAGQAGGAGLSGRGRPGHRPRNLRDFPASDLGQWEIEAKSPDAFVREQVGINVRAVAASVRQIADSRTNPPESVEDILSQLERDGLVESVAAIRAT